LFRAIETKWTKPRETRWFFGFCRRDVRTGARKSLRGNALQKVRCVVNTRRGDKMLALSALVALNGTEKCVRLMSGTRQNEGAFCSILCVVASWATFRAATATAWRGVPAFVVVCAAGRCIAWGLAQRFQCCAYLFTSRGHFQAKNLPAGKLERQESLVKGNLRRGVFSGRIVRIISCAGEIRCAGREPPSKRRWRSK
jgi:hypothetical protein